MNITTSGFWKKENKKTFAHYSLFQQYNALALVTLNAIPYSLYFDEIDDVDDENHIGDFDAFFPGLSKYLTLSLVVDLATLMTRDDTACAQSIFDVYIRLLDPCLIACN